MGVHGSDARENQSMNYTVGNITPFLLHGTEHAKTRIAEPIDHRVSVKRPACG